MSISSKSRVLAVGLAGASALALALGGASAAQADSRILSQTTFTVPAPTESWQVHIEVWGDIQEPMLPESAFDAVVNCADGNSYSVVSGLGSNWDYHVSSFLPLSEAGDTCHFTLGVTSIRTDTTTNFWSVVAGDDKPYGSDVHIQAQVAKARPRPQY